MSTQREVGDALEGQNGRQIAAPARVSNGPLHSLPPSIRTRGSPPKMRRRRGFAVDFLPRVAKTAEHPPERKEPSEEYSPCRSARPRSNRNSAERRQCVWLNASTRRSTRRCIHSFSRVLRFFFGGEGKSGNESRRMEGIGIRGCRDRLRSSICSVDKEMTPHDIGATGG